MRIAPLALLAVAVALAGCSTPPADPQVELIPEDGATPPVEPWEAEAQHPPEEAPPEKPRTPAPPREDAPVKAEPVIAVQVVPLSMWATSGGELVIPIYVANPTARPLRVSPLLVLGSWRHRLDPMELPPETSGRFERAVAVPATLRAGTYPSQIVITIPDGAGASADAIRTHFVVHLERTDATGEPVSLTEHFSADVVSWPELPADATVKTPVDARLIAGGLLRRISGTTFLMPPTVNGRKNAVAVVPRTPIVIPLPDHPGGAIRVALLATTLRSPAKVTLTLTCAGSASAKTITIVPDDPGDGYRTIRLAPAEDVPARTVAGQSHEPLILAEILASGAASCAPSLEIAATEGRLYLLAVTVK